MENNYTIQDLSKLLVEFGRKKHGEDYAYSFALGTVVGLTDFYLKYHPDRMQLAVNERYEMCQRELAAL